MVTLVSKINVFWSQKYTEDCCSNMCVQIEAKYLTEQVRFSEDMHR